MGSWTLDDIPWQRFDRTQVEPEIMRIVKAASLVEHNGAAYARHLCRIFADDPDFRETARRWGAEEMQHGVALARWATMADPGFDFAAAFARFQEGFRVDFDTAQSRRGSHAGEMVARCVVEIGTSSYYTALREAATEPVLREICRRIAADELRHYRLFYDNLRRCLERERLGRFARLLIALRRMAESEDDELAYAYYAANENGQPYDRRRCSRAYARRAFALYRRHHVERGVAMLLKAAGMTPNGRLSIVASRLLWQILRWRGAGTANGSDVAAPIGAD
jgi:rubrerythrin